MNVNGSENSFLIASLRSSVHYNMGIWRLFVPDTQLRVMLPYTQTIKQEHMLEHRNIIVRV